MQPSSPDPKFDFMLKNNQPAAKGLGLPHFSKLIKIILAVILVIVLLVITSSVLSNRNKASSQDIVAVLARGQEIVRVTSLSQTQLSFKDPETKALAATVSASLSSDSQQLSDYLAKNNTKVSVALLAADTDKTSDSQLQSASQNNNLDDAYKAYLKENLAKYALVLQAAYKNAGPNGKAILKNSFDSTQTLLQSNLLKS